MFNVSNIEGYIIVQFICIYNLKFVMFRVVTWHKLLFGTNQNTTYLLSAQMDDIDNTVYHK